MFQGPLPVLRFLSTYWTMQHSWKSVFNQFIELTTEILHDLFFFLMAFCWDDFLDFSVVLNNSSVVVQHQTLNKGFMRLFVVFYCFILPNFAIKLKIIIYLKGYDSVCETFMSERSFNPREFVQSDFFRINYSNWCWIIEKPWFVTRCRLFDLLAIFLTISLDFSTT